MSNMFVHTHYYRSYKQKKLYFRITGENTYQGLASAGLLHWPLYQYMNKNGIKTELILSGNFFQYRPQSCRKKNMYTLILMVPNHCQV